jgi:hypothetical protein
MYNYVGNMYNYVGSDLSTDSRISFTVQIRTLSIGNTECRLRLNNG